MCARALRDGAAAGRSSVSYFILPLLMRLGARRPGSGRADEPIGEAPQDGNREWRTWVEQQDEVLRYCFNGSVFSTEVNQGTARRWEVAGPGHTAGNAVGMSRQGLDRCLSVCPEGTGRRSVGTPGRSRSTCPCRRRRRRDRKSVV